MNTLRTFDLIVLIAYIAGVVLMGCYFMKRSRSTEGFMAAGRRLPGWAIGLSIFGTFVSSMSFLGMPSTAFSGDWNRFVFSISLPIAGIFAVTFFVPFYRKSNEISAYHHLELRFGLWARTYAVVCYLLKQLARIGAVMYLVSLSLVPLTGWPVEYIIVGTGILVTLYTLVGGIEAVIWTDVVQSIVLIAGAVLCVFVLLFGAPDGPAQIFELANQENKFSLGSFGTSLAESTFWVVLLYGLFENLTNFGIDQTYVQRYATARSEDAAKRSVWMGVLMYVPMAAVFLFIGTALFGYYSLKPHMLEDVKQQMAASQIESETPDLGVDEFDAAVARRAGEFDNAAIADKVFPHFIVNVLPAGISGLLIAAIFAAAMSSVDSSLNCSATLVLRDVYQRYFRPEAGEKESMAVLYTTTLVWGAAGTVIALLMIQVESAFDAWWALAGILSGGMLGLFLLGLIVKRADSPAAATGVVLGVIVILWMSLPDVVMHLNATFPDLKLQFPPEGMEWLRSPFHNFMILVVGTLTVFLAGMVVSGLRGKREK